MLIRTKGRPGDPSDGWANREPARLIYLTGDAIFTHGEYGVNITCTTMNPLSFTVYHTPQLDDNNQTRPSAERLAESLNVFDYIQWCIEGEKTIATSRPFTLDLSGDIPAKPFTFNPASGGSESDDDDDF